MSDQKFQRVNREKASRAWGKVETRPDGFPACRECGAACKGRRRTFCSAECVERWSFQTDPGFVRRKVEERDKGVCRSCGFDTEVLRRQLWRLRALVYRDRDRCMLRDLMDGRGGLTRSKYIEVKIRRINGILAKHGWVGKREGEYGWSIAGLTGALWQADHIVAVKLGGGLVTLEGYHKRKTREDRAAMRARGKSGVQEETQGQGVWRQDPVPRREGGDPGELEASSQAVPGVAAVPVRVVRGVAFGSPESEGGAAGTAEAPEGQAAPG